MGGMRSTLTRGFLIAEKGVSGKGSGPEWAEW